MRSETLPEAIPRGREARKKGIVASVALAAAVTAITVGSVAFVQLSGRDAQPASSASTSDDVRIDVDSNPPHSLIAAGRVAMSAYWTESWRELGSNEHKLSRGTLVTTVKRAERTWYLYNPRSDAYERTEWSWVDVAPGMRQAAVLEGELPSKRLGILDLSTREVRTWVELPTGIAGVSWSSDGKTILATGYDRNPDDIEFVNDHTRYGAKGPSPRTGFLLVDAATLKARFHAVEPEARQGVHERSDFRWVSPAIISSQATSRSYYGLDGKARQLSSAELEPPENQAGQAGASPNGKLLAGPAGMPTKVTERSTGRIVGTQPVLDLLAWADDDHLIALGCEGTCADEFRNALVLVSVDGADVKQLSAFRATDEDWHPVLTQR